MRTMLLSLIPWSAAYFALLFTVYSYTGEIPNAWILLAGFFAGVAWGSRSLLR